MGSTWSPGATAGWDQTGYVFDPAIGYQITGWRKSDAEWRRSPSRTPILTAERTGRPANVGVIGGWQSFGERPQQTVYTPPTLGRSPPSAEAARDFRVGLVAGRVDGKAQAGGGANSASMDKRMAPAAPSLSGSLRADAPAQKLGTGHGEREYSYVNHTEFVRMQAQPNEVIRHPLRQSGQSAGDGHRQEAAADGAGDQSIPASPEQQYVPDPAGIMPRGGVIMK